MRITETYGFSFQRRVAVVYNPYLSSCLNAVGHPSPRVLAMDLSLRQRKWLSQQSSYLSVDWRPFAYIDNKESGVLTIYGLDHNVEQLAHYLISIDMPDAESGLTLRQMQK